MLVQEGQNGPCWVRLMGILETIPPWYRKGGTGPFFQEKLNKAIRDQIYRAQKRLGKDLITEDLCHQSLEAPGIQTPTIDTTLVLVKQQSVSDHEKVDIEKFAATPLSIDYTRPKEIRKTTRQNRRTSLDVQYLTIILRRCAGCEMIYNQRSA